MKIVVRLMAGLANQMFQFAYYENIKNQGYDVYLDDRYKAKIKTERIVFTDIFPNVKYKRAPFWLTFKMGGGYDIISYLRRNYTRFNNCIYVNTEQYNNPIEKAKKDMYLLGVFQSEKYFNSVAERIKNNLAFNPFTDKTNIDFEQQLSQEESVAIHIRKGKDYSTIKKYVNTCNIKYYKSAISYLKTHAISPKFYVFTDNKEWVKENLKDIEYTLVDWNPTQGWGNHFDMQLMSCCKHNIIANSTYSWWGAWLNPNPNKIVIGPKQWFNPEMKHLDKVSENTLCKGWVAL